MFWDSVVWVTSNIISLLLCSPHSFLLLGLCWAFCSGHNTSWSLTFENARRGTLKVYLVFSSYWIWHVWPVIINISKWIVSKEIIHTNNNFVKTWNFARLRKICSTWQQTDIYKCNQGNIVRLLSSKSLLSWKIVIVQNTRQVNIVMDFMAWNSS